MLVVVLVLLFGATEGTHQQVCSAVAHVGRWWYNGCSQRCICAQVSGEFVWDCYRERKEYTCMSVAERTLYINTYKAISTPGHPQYSQYQTLIARHSTNFGTIHTSQYFLPWHRWFSMEMENLLQNVNCTVTLPWYDTAKNAGAPFGVPPWGASADLLGTSGACVNDGGFASPGWPNNAHGCLSRTNSGTMPTSMQEAAVLAMNSANYVAFTDALEIQIHNIPHVRIGGTMLQTWSPEAPEFFLHHGHIDKLWDDWQKKSNAHLNAYSFPFELAHAGCLRAHSSTI
jgi:tyrosinase